MLLVFVKLSTLEPYYGTSRSRRQPDALSPNACRKSLHRCAWSEKPTLRAISLSESVLVIIK
jgi:hypothetical protein